MTDDEFETRVRELVRQNPGMPEGDARLQVGVDAGIGGDVDSGMADEDPVALLDRLGNTWAPISSTDDRTAGE